MEAVHPNNCGGGAPAPAPEARVHFQVTKFIKEAGVKLGMQSIPMATACTLYHKFFCEINLGTYDPYLVAMSSIYLDGKVEAQHLQTRDIINVSNRCLVTTLPSQSLIILYVISFRFMPWIQTVPKALAQTCSKRSPGCLAAWGQCHHITVMASPQKTSWEDWVCCWRWAGEGDDMLLL